LVISRVGNGTPHTSAGAQGNTLGKVDPGLHPGLVGGAPLGRWLTGHLFETKRPKSSCGPEARAPTGAAPVFPTIQLTHTKPGSPSIF